MVRLCSFVSESTTGDGGRRMTPARVLAALRCWWRRRTIRRNWWVEFHAADEELTRIKRILQSQLTPKEPRAQHMADLEQKNAVLKQEIRAMQIAAERHNVESYATGLIVNCTGCWWGRPADAESLTEEEVAAVEGIARRLRTWWEGEKWRRKRNAQ